MKWLAVAVAILASVVIGALAQTRRPWRVVLATLVGFCPYLPTAVNPISYESYRGDARGLELTPLDFVALALAVSLAGRPWKRPWPVLTSAYLATAVVSVISAPMPIFVAFGVWRLVRIHRILATVAQAGRDGLVPDICRGLALGVLYSTVLAIEQRYLGGKMQVSGPFSHQNGLAMACNMVFPFCLALILAGKGGNLAKAAVAAAALSIVLTLSRGGMLLFGVAAALVVAGSMARKLTGRKLGVLLIGVLGVTAVLIKSFDTIVQRFSSAPDASAEARDKFEHAASLMLADHPLGVGFNQFSSVLDLSYADRVGLPEVDRNGLAHNIYALTAAELGYLGIFAFVLLFAAPVVVAIRTAREKGLRGDLSVGLAAGLAVTLLQGKLEWALRTTQLNALFWILGGVAFALSRSSGDPANRPG